MARLDRMWRFSCDLFLCFMGKRGGSLQNLEKSWEQMQEFDPRKQKNKHKKSSKHVFFCLFCCLLKSVWTMRRCELLSRCQGPAPLQKVALRCLKRPLSPASFLARKALFFCFFDWMMDHDAIKTPDVSVGCLFGRTFLKVAEEAVANYPPCVIAHRIRARRSSREGWDKVHAIPSSILWEKSMKPSQSGKENSERLVKHT